MCEDQIKMREKLANERKSEKHLKGKRKRVKNLTRK